MLDGLVHPSQGTVVRMSVLFQVLGLAEQFQQIVEDYVSQKYEKRV